MVGSGLATAALAASALGAGAGAVSAYKQGKQQQAAMEYQADVDRANAEIAEKNAELSENQASALQRSGLEEAQSSRRRAAQVIAERRALGGASGLDTDSGSLLLAQTDIAEQGEADAAAQYQKGLDQAYNARVQAWNYKNQAEVYRSQADAHEAQGRAYNKAGKLSALGSALSGAASLGETWGAWNKTLAGDWWAGSRSGAKKDG